MDSSTDKIVGCTAVNEHVNKPIPDILWHYTSFAGFQGIITSKKIWATEYRFLNDREEFLHAKELAQELVAEEPEYIGENFPNRDNISDAVAIAFNTGPLREDRIFVMVASFTEEGDQLSQWRGYADDSRGVSIGFDLRNIRPASSIGSAATFAPCLYKKAEKCALLKAIFTNYREGLLEWWQRLVVIARERRSGQGWPDPQLGQKIVAEHRQELHAVLIRGQATLRYDLLRAAPLLKNESFAEEKEWRLVLPWDLKNGLPTVQPLEFRNIRDTLVPYIPFRLIPDEQERFPFRNLILGSGSHPSAEIGVNLFLQKEKIPIEARRSPIPYRPT